MCGANPAIHTTLPDVLGETRSRASTTFLCGQALGEEHHMVHSESISKHRDEFGISPCWEHAEGKFWVSQALARITHTVTTVVKGTASLLWALPQQLGPVGPECAMGSVLPKHTHFAKSGWLQVNSGLASNDAHMKWLLIVDTLLHGASWSVLSLLMIKLGEYF